MPKTRRDKSNYTIQSVAHALDVLEVFNDEDAGEFGVTELSRKLKLHKNNVFRLLATLESRGYVEQNPVTENYRLGVKSLQLGQSFVRRTGLVRQARPIMAELVRDLGETAQIAVLRNHAVVYIDAIESSQTVRVVSRVGAHLPIHATASGKAMLAFESEDEVDRVLAQPPEHRAGRTLMDVEVLRRELQKVQALGFAVDDEEYEEGVRCVSAPVRDYTNRVVGALTVSGPSVRLGLDRIASEIGPRVRQAAGEASQRLGHGLDQVSSA